MRPWDPADEPAPVPIGPAGWLLDGWQTHGIWSFQTGRPFTVALPSELDNSGTGRSVLGFGANDRPHLVGDARLERPTPERWFNAGAFAIPERARPLTRMIARAFDAYDLSKAGHSPAV